jgi:hypothetical protein
MPKKTKWIKVVDKIDILIIFVTLRFDNDSGKEMIQLLKDARKTAVKFHHNESQSS